MMMNSAKIVLSSIVVISLSATAEAVQIMKTYKDNRPSWRETPGVCRYLDAVGLNVGRKSIVAEGYEEILLPTYRSLGRLGQSLLTTAKPPLQKIRKILPQNMRRKNFPGTLNQDAEIEDAEIRSSPQLPADDNDAPSPRGKD